jgi:CDP-diacylglycerol--serine O-phosphatidyltransferase
MCGFFSVLSTFNGEYVRAALFIIFAHILDGIDGYAARLTKTTSQFGVELDSLADVVSFGVAPAILAYFWALVPWGNWGWLAACTYVVCGALRLARFNVQAKGVAKGHFVGLPIPAAAEMIVSTVLLYYYLGGEGAPNKQITLLLDLRAGAAMVSGFPISLKNNGSGKRFDLTRFGIFLITLFVDCAGHVFYLVQVYVIRPSWGCFALKRRRRREEMAGAQPARSHRHNEPCWPGRGSFYLRMREKEGSPCQRRNRSKRKQN